MAKNKKRRKKIAPKVRKLKPATYIRLHARKTPVYECLIRDDWREVQFSPVIVTRRKKNGNVIMGSYVVDMQCLGVKDADYYHDVDFDRYKEVLKGMEMGMDLRFIKIEPNLCFNIIYGAVEFAEDCGFEPHEDFAVAEYILDDVESIIYEEVPLGKDGQPLYISGPFDDSARILATLDKNVGKGNYIYLTEITPDDMLD